MTEARINVATIIHSGDGEYDDLLRIFVDEIKAQGWNVQGLLTKQSKNPMIIYNLNDGQEFIISQSLGNASQSCSLDLGNLASAAFVLRNALKERAALVIVNRFGVAEADGKGFVAELIALISEGIPVLTLTNKKYLTAWRNFTGGLAIELEPSMDALHCWCESIKNN